MRQCRTMAYENGILGLFGLSGPFGLDQMTKQTEQTEQTKQTFSEERGGGVHTRY